MSTAPLDPTAALWQQALTRLNAEAPDSLYQTIFQMGSLKGLEGDTLVIALPYAYLLRLFGPAELGRLNDLFSEIAGYRLATRLIHEAPGDTQFAQLAAQKREQITHRKEQLLGDATKALERSAPRTIGLNANLSFATFVVREVNQLAAAAAQAVANQPGGMYNPLYVYGATGLGKTHLLHAIGNAAVVRDPQARLAAVNAEDFANEFIEAIRNKNTKGFRDKYGAFDALLIDDLHILINKPNCQEAFLHAFNTFHDAHRQIVVTADRKPRDLATFPERLISRLEGGLVTDLARPPFETRLAILQAKAQQLELPVTAETLEIIANLVTTNVRALEGCLKMLQAKLALRPGAPPSHDEIERTVMDYLSTTSPNEEVMDLGTIMERLSTHYRVPIAEIVSKKRASSIAHPRQMVMYFTRLLTHMSLEEIGRAIGGRDHSTVLYAVQKISGRAGVDPAFRREVEFVRSILVGSRQTPPIANEIRELS